MGSKYRYIQTGTGLQRQKSRSLRRRLFFKTHRKVKQKKDRFFSSSSSLFFLNFPACRVYLVGFNEELPGVGRKAEYGNRSHFLFFICSFHLIHVPRSFLFL